METIPPAIIGTSISNPLTIVQINSANAMLIIYQSIEKHIEKIIGKNIMLFINNCLSKRYIDTNQKGNTITNEIKTDFVVKSISFMPFKFISIIQSFVINTQILK